MTRYDTDFNVNSARLTKLCKMGILLGTDYNNPLDIGSSSVTKNWVNLIKMHLKCPRVDSMALLRGTCAFALELEGGEMVIGKV